MGIALTTLSAFSVPLRSLTRWFHSTAALAMPSAAGSPPPRSPHDGTDRGDGRGTAGSRSIHRPQGLPGPRPLRGNWPFTVNTPQTPPAESPGRQAATRRAPPAMPVPPAGSRSACAAPRPTDGSGRRTAKVLRRISAPGTGRLVITGRMADVCAELDRMVACEGALQAS